MSQSCKHLFVVKRNHNGYVNVKRFENHQLDNVIATSINKNASINTLNINSSSCNNNTKNESKLQFIRQDNYNKFLSVLAFGITLV